MESLCKPRVEPTLFELYRGAAKFRKKQNNGNFPILTFSM